MGGIELRRHRVKILRPGGEDEEGAFGTGEEALALGLFGDGFLLEMDEGEAAVDGDVLHVALAGGDAGGDEDGVVLGSLDPRLAIMLPRLGVDVTNLGAHVGRIREGGVAIREALVEGELPHACHTMAEDLRLERPAQQEEVAEGRVAHATDGEAQAALHELRHARLQDGPPRVVMHIRQHGLQLVRCVQHRVVVVIIEQRLLLARERGVVARALRAGHAVRVGGCCSQGRLRHEHGRIHAGRGAGSGGRGAGAERGGVGVASRRWLG